MCNYAERIPALVKQHNEIESKYDELYSQQSKAKDDGEARITLRTIAQDALSTLLELKHIYEELCSSNSEKYSGSLQKTVDQINVWIKRLEKLGSPISGVPNTTFEEIAGLEDVKQTVRNYLFALQHPKVASFPSTSLYIAHIINTKPSFCQ